MSKLDKMLQSFNKGGGHIFRLEAGESAIVRVFPPYHEDQALKAKKLGAALDERSGILVCNQHPFLPRLDGQTRDDGSLKGTNYRCLNDLGKPCGFCGYFDSLPKSDDGIKREHGCNAVGMIDLVRDGRQQRWFFKKLVLQRLNEIFEQEPDLNHPKRSRSLVVTRKGSGMATRYLIKVGKKVKPFPLPESDWPDILDELENMPVLTPKEIARVLKLKFGV